MLEVRKLFKRYGSTVALSDISFALEPGVYVVTGPNGAGKTTLLRTLCGAVQPSSGEISLNGIDTLNDRAGARRHISYLADDVPLYSDLTVEGQLIYRGRLKGLSSRRLRARIRHVTDAFNLKPIYTKPTSVITAGQRKCVGIADAMLLDYFLLALDEPFHGLDAFHADLFIKALNSVSRHAIVLVATHRLDFAEAINGKCIVMANGVIASQFRISQPENTDRVSGDGTSLSLAERVREALRTFYAGGGGR